ncbi:MAG: low molecular weight protein-tyrosine-phosphatase, partial [Cytophagales bacterium]
NIEGVVDSAGTANYHIGSKPDYRTLQVLNEHKISTGHRARQVQKSDFEHFDMIIAMDTNNFNDLIEVFGVDMQKPKNLFLAGDFYSEKGANVPDPYYGTINDFRKVYEMLDEICDNLISKTQ